MKKNIDFIGKGALKKIKHNGIKKKQVGLVIDCDPLAGPNTTFWPVYKEGIVIGKITSAVYSPRLKKNIALAMVEVSHSKIGSKLDVKIDNINYLSNIVEVPFYDPQKKITRS